MSRTWPVVAAAAFLAWVPVLPAQEKLTREQMDEDLRELVAVVRRAYAYVDEKKADAGVDLDKLLADARKKLAGVKSNADFHDLLKEVVAGLKDGHCEVYAGHLMAPRPRSWPFALNFVKEGVMVTVTHPAVAGRGIEVGDLVLELNGRPVGEWVGEATRRVSASSDGARRKMALRRMTATADEAITVKVEHPDGKAATLPLKTVPELKDPPEAKFAAGRVLEHGVGYVRVPSFAWNAPEFQNARTDADRDAALKPARDQVDAAFAAAADAKALVLDLRGNGGGADLLGAYLASHFLADDFCYYATRTRSSPDLRRLPGFAHLPKEDGWADKWPWHPRKTAFTFYKGKPYVGRLAVLVNETCFSTTDCVCAVLADLYPGVRFVGRPTNGGSGGPTVVARLPHSKADIQLCVMKVWSPKGRLIEGHGTRPDVPVEWTREDVLEGRDPDLEAARKELRR